MFTLITTLATLLLIILISSWLTRRIKNTSAREYFMASGKLSFGFIAGSMMLTNVSVDQLIGLNGDAYLHNLSAIAWEATAIIAIIALALFFLPRYMQSGFTTLTGFIESRYDRTARKIVSILLLMTYTLVLCPSSLYLGALTLEKIFNVQQLLGISYQSSLVAMICLTGAIGTAYAVFGGLRAIAVSDTINGVFLLAIIFLVPVLGFIALGHGHFQAGVHELLRQNPQKLNMIGNAHDSVPFSTLFTGMIFANLFYWCTNQAIMQKSLAARSLEEAQKGILLTGAFKLILPLLMMLPGIIAWHYFRGHPLASSDLAYPALIAALLPWWLKGFFVAIILGAVMSHFNAILNASATLLTYDFYLHRRPAATDRQQIRFGKLMTLLVALISIACAPLLMHAPDGIYTLLRRFTGFFNMPVIAIVLFAFLVARPPAIAAKVVLVFHALLYGIFILGLNVDARWGISFIHLMGILFACEMLLLFALNHYLPSGNKGRLPDRGSELVGWRYALPVSIALIAALISLYLTFSPLGLVSGHLQRGWYIAMVVVWGLAVILTIRYFSRPKSPVATHRTPSSVPLDNH